MADENQNETEETTEVTPEPPVSDSAPAVSDTPADAGADDAPAEEPETAPEAPAAEAPAAEAPAAEAPAAEEPVAEETPAAAEPEAEATPEPAPQSEPKKKGKRLPRAQRPQKTRPTRERATTRKPISREEKPEHERGRRQERRGVVVSDAMDKTIVVKVDAVRSHPRYKKVIRRSIKFHAHDEQNSAHIGDVVRIVETRPLSKTKHWRLAEIVEVAK
jgi:small subunit ribosomal protein S17